MLKIINLIIAGLSFIFGLFIAKKIGDADKLKIQVKQFEENQKTQNEILQRNINSTNVDTSNKRLWLKTKRNNK
jgi:predicted solute-binding protein